VSGSFTRQTLPTPKKIGIIAEDTYAVKFLEGIIKRLNDAKIIAQEIKIIRSRSTYGVGNVCNAKTRRIIDAWEDEVDKILLFMDADGMPIEDKIKECKKIIGDSQKVKPIIFEQEIEEWITKSTQQKPSEELKTTERYEKYMLPNYVSRIKLDDPKLMNLRSFKGFLNALNDP